MKRIIFYTFFIFLVIPIVLMLKWSFTVSYPWPDLLFSNFTLDGYRFWMDFSYYSTVLNSIILSLIVTFISLFLGYNIARVITYRKCRYIALIKIIVVLPLLVPISTLILGVYYQFLLIGINNIIGVILVHIFITLPYAVIVLKMGFDSHPLKLEHQAYLLHASPLNVLVRITIPQLLPSIIAAFTIVFSISYSQYFINLVIGSGRVNTYSMDLFPYIMNNDRFYASVFSVIFVLTIIIVVNLFSLVLRLIYRNMYK